MKIHYFWVTATITNNQVPEGDDSIFPLSDVLGVEQTEPDEDYFNSLKKNLGETLALFAKQHGWVRNTDDAGVDIKTVSKLN